MYVTQISDGDQEESITRHFKGKVAGNSAATLLETWLAFDNDGEDMPATIDIVDYTILAGAWLIRAVYQIGEERVGYFLLFSEEK